MYLIALRGHGFGVHWRIRAGATQSWLGATVVQVIGVVYLLTRYLFPSRSE